MANPGLLDRAADLAGGAAANATATKPAWTLVASERGAGGGSRPVGSAGSYSEARKLALAISDLGLLVSVLDAEDRVRLRMWPAQPD